MSIRKGHAAGGKAVRGALDQDLLSEAIGMRNVGYIDAKRYNFQHLDQAEQAAAAVGGERGARLLEAAYTFDDRVQLPAEALVPANGIVMFGIGVGTQYLLSNSIETTELRSLSSEPREMNVNYYPVTSYANLDGIRRSVVDSVCEAEAPPTVGTR